MLHRFKPIFLFALLTALCGGMANAKTPKVVALFLQETLNKDGQQLPIEKNLERLLRYFERESGLRFERHVLPWNRAQKMTKDGEVMLWPVRELERVDQVEDYLQKKLIPSFNDPDLKGKVFNVSAQPMFYDTVHFASVKGKYEAEIELLNQVIRRGTKNGSLAKVLYHYY